MRFSRRSRVVLREPRIDDARGIAQVLVESWRAAYGDILPSELLAGMSVSKRQEQLEIALAAPKPTGAVRLVAERDGAIIGFANAGIVSSGSRASEGRVTLGAPSGEAGESAAEPRIGELAVLYVSSEHWRQGVGHKLARRAVRQLDVSGCEEVHAWVMDGNDRAFMFLEHQGWTRSSIQRRELLDGHIVRQTRMDKKLVD